MVGGSGNASSILMYILYDIMLLVCGGASIDWSVANTILNRAVAHQSHKPVMRTTGTHCKSTVDFKGMFTNVEVE